MFCSTINCGASLRTPVTHLLASSHVDGCEHSSRCTENVRKTKPINCFPHKRCNGSFGICICNKTDSFRLKTGHFVWKIGCWQVHKHPNINQSKNLIKWVTNARWHKSKYARTVVTKAQLCTHPWPIFSYLVYFFLGSPMLTMVPWNKKDGTCEGSSRT